MAEKKRWVHGVKTVSTFPPKELFTKDAETIARRSRAGTKALKLEGHQAASRAALARQAKQQAHTRTAAQRSAIARKAAKTRLAHQSHAQRSAIARKAARTRLARS